MDNERRTPESNQTEPPDGNRSAGTGKIKAFVCTVCGRDIPADPAVFEEEITKEEVQQIGVLYCPDCCGWFMIPVEGPTFGGGIVIATGESFPAQFPKMDLRKSKQDDSEKENENDR